MRKHAYPESEHTANDGQLATDARMNGGLPDRLMTAFEVAGFVGRHEETVRRMSGFVQEEWRARQDSNLWPSAPEADALSS